MHTVINVLAIIGAAVIAVVVVCAIGFLRQISKNGWNQWS